MESDFTEVSSVMDINISFIVLNGVSGDALKEDSYSVFEGM